MAGIHERYLKNPVAKDLGDGMVFIGGHSQAGKTTFALTFLSEPTEKHPAYLNWDISAPIYDFFPFAQPASFTLCIPSE
jgi:hypothetical protein